MDNKRPLIAHLCLFCSGAFWGLMAPVGKDAMLHGIDGIDLVSFRVLGGALLFWIASANSTSKCKITKCFCKSTPLVLRNSIFFLVSH